MAKRDSTAPGQRLRNWLRRHFVQVVVLPALVATMLAYDAALAHCDEPSRLNSYAFYGALGAADFASTELALSRGGREANPLPGMQSIGGRGAWKALSTVGMAELDYLLVRKGKRKARWGVRAGMAVLCAVVVTHNAMVRVMAKRNPKRRLT